MYKHTHMKLYIYTFYNQPTCLYKFDQNSGKVAGASVSLLHMSTSGFCCFDVSECTYLFSPTLVGDVWYHGY